MSDALLERLATAAEGILAHIKKSPVFGVPTTGAATPPKAGPTGGAASGGKPADKVAADKAAAEKAAAKAATDKAAATKAPIKGGKRTDAQVREMIRKVAADKNLGKQAAKNILADDGGGVERVLDLKPEFYDAVFEACEVLLKGEGEKPGAAPEEEDDLM